MITRQLFAIALTVAAVVPAAHASAERLSVKACANAFASSMAAPGAAVPGYKLDYSSHFSSTLADFYPTEYTYTLEARDPKTGVAFARATCVADSRGSVTSISTVPLDTKLATR